MQENDPKHTSTLVKAWLEKEEINWWKTLLNHQTLNQIKNLWHELKEYLRQEVKPKTRDKMMDGIQCM